MASCRTIILFTAARGDFDGTKSPIGLILFYFILFCYLDRWIKINKPSRRTNTCVPNPRGYNGGSGGATGE